jgi:hypothetical protein
MIRVRATCTVSGPNFSPRTAEAQTGLRFARKSEPGELSEVDRYQGHTPGHGRAELALQDYGTVGDLTGKNAGTLEALGRSLEALRRSGATDLRLKFDVEYAGPCAFDFSADLLRRLGDLGLPLHISCFEAQETEEMSQRGFAREPPERKEG